jgi:hypothetical protein
MDSKRTAYEKMICITECSKNIYKAINVSTDIRNMIEANNAQRHQKKKKLKNKKENDQNLSSSSSSLSSLSSTLSTSSSSLSSSISSLSNDTNKEAKKHKSSKTKAIASADDYLPAFIYIVLKANPTMLYSNLNFISRFAFEKRVLQGIY